MIVSVLSAIFVLGVLVFVHELGHFLAAKRMGVKVEQFSLGFPPKMIGKQVGETEYVLSWIPLGGYVKMAGEHPDSAEIKGEPWEFQSKSIWARAFIIIAGPVMNILLTFLVLFALLLVLGVATIATTTVGKVEPRSPFSAAGLQVGDRITAVNNTPVTTWEEVVEQVAAPARSQFQLRFTRAGVDSMTTLTFSPEQSEQTRLASIAGAYFMDPTVSAVNPGSPAAKAGIQSGDVITAINTQRIRQWTEMVDLIRSQPGVPLTIEWLRKGEAHQATIIPEATSEINPATGKMDNIGRIGVAKESYRTKPVGVVDAIKLSGFQTVDLTGRMVSFLKQLLTGGVSAKMVGGPIFIAQMAGQNARRGAESLFSFIAFLSLNLAILNLLPIPALDGGQLFILAVEGIIRRPLSLKQRMVWQQVGMAILACLMVFVIVNDVSRILR